MTDAATVQNLQKGYRGRPVLQGLSFRVPAGAISLYLGPNGAGKTTTFRLLAGLKAPDAGQIELLGGPPAHALRRRMAVMLEEPRFYPYLSGLDNLRIVAQARQITARDWPRESLRRVGLAGAAHRPVGTYSQGMRQRLYLASCLLPELELLLLDEPTNGLDVEGRQELWSLLGDLRDGGVSLLISTHQILETERLAEYVVILHGGRCAFEGTSSALAAQQRTVVRVGDPADPTACARLAALGANPVTDRRDEWWLDADHAPAALAHLAAQGVAVTPRTEDLEELYWRLKDVR